MITKEEVLQAIDGFFAQSKQNYQDWEQNKIALWNFLREIFAKNPSILYELFWEGYNQPSEASHGEEGSRIPTYDIFLAIGGSTYTADTLKFVGELLLDSDFPWQEDAADILGEWQNPDALSYLIDALGDEDYGVVAKAVLALGNIGDVKAEPYLLALLDKTDYEDDFEREVILDRVIEALASLNTPRAWERIKRVAIHHANSELRQKAIRVMAHGLNNQAVHHLEILVTDEDADVASFARWHLEKLDNDHKV